MDDAELLRELRENCQCFQRPTFADPPCAMCKAASALEADAQKEAALKALCDDLGIGLARLVSGIRALLRLGRYDQRFTHPNY